MPVFKEVPVQTLRQHAHCECGEGEFKFTGKMQPGNSPLYAHTCDSCAKTASLDDVYPRLITRTVQ